MAGVHPLPPDFLERPHVGSKMPTENSRGGRLRAKKSLQVTTVTDGVPERQGKRRARCGPAPPGMAGSTGVSAATDLKGWLNNAAG